MSFPVNANSSDQQAWQQSHQQTWPKLLGMNVSDAEAIIKKNRPDLKVYPTANGVPVWANIDFGRVFVWYDPITKKVTSVPRPG